jgi:hypothetical protein
VTSHDGYRFRPPALLVQHTIALLLFLALAAAFLAPALTADRALLPTALLEGMSPWADTAGAVPSADAARLPWNPLLWDAIAQFYPWRAFAAQWMRAGTIPLWDPHQFCGTPFLANSQSAVLYPLHFLLLDLPRQLHPARSMLFLALTHLTLAGFLTFLFLRSLGLTAPAAWLGGVIFMLSGFAVTWLELPSFLTVACWLPLLLLNLNRLLDRPSLCRACGIGAAVGLLLLGGHLQIAFYCLLGAALFAGGCLLFRTAGGRRTRLVTLMLLGGALGVMLAAPQLLPAVELSRSSHRVSVTSVEGYRTYLGGAMPVWQLIRLFLPDFWGNPTRGGYLAGSPADYTEYAGYISGVGLLLAAAALPSWKRRPWETGAAAAITGLSLLLALGTPLNALFYFGIPGFSQSGSPARVLVLFCFGGAWLAALGAEAVVAGLRGSTHVLGNDKEQSVGAAAPIGPYVRLAVGSLAVWLLLLAGSLAAARQFAHGRGADFGALLGVNTPALVQAVVLALLAAGLPLALRFLIGRESVAPTLALRLGSGTLAVLTLGELWQFGASFNPTGPLAAVYPKTPLIEALTNSAAGAGRVLPVNRRWSLFEHPHAVLPPNCALALGLADPQGYDSLFLGTYKGLSNMIAGPGADSAPPENGNMLFVSNLASPLLPLLAADRVVTGHAVSEPVPEVNPAAGGPEGLSPLSRWPVLVDQSGVQIRRYPTALPRAFVARNWRAVAEERVVDELNALASARRLGTTALLTGESAAGTAGGRGGAARLRQVGPNQLEVTIGERTAPGTLVVLDSYAAGWRAFDADTGRSLPLYRAHLAFRGVPVAASTRAIRMRYEPASFRVGLYLAMLAVAAMATAWMTGCSRRGRREPGV